MTGSVVSSRVSLVPHKPPGAAAAPWGFCWHEVHVGLRALGCGSPQAWGCQGLWAQQQAPCPGAPLPAPPGDGLLPAAHSRST